MTRPDIHRSDTLRVMPNVADEARLAASGFELVTFEPLWRGNRPKVFGQAFATKYGLNALHVVPEGSSWYQYPDIDACLAAIARVTRPGATAVGASMGAYAAVTLADRFGAARSVAMAPQFSIQRHLAPFETRWAADAARLTFHAWDGSVAKGCRHYVVFQPGTLDEDHARLIMAHGEDVVPVAVPAGGHTVSKVLVEAGALSRIVLSVIQGTPSGEDLLAEITPKLERSAQWHLNRGIHAPPEEREALLRAGLEVDPKHIWLHYTLGACLAAERRFEDALPHLTFVALRRPMLPKVQRLYIKVCVLTGTEPHPLFLKATAANAPTT